MFFPSVKWVKMFQLPNSAVALQQISAKRHTERHPINTDRKPTQGEIQQSLGFRVQGLGTRRAHGALRIDKWNKEVTEMDLPDWVVQVDAPCQPGPSILCLSA